MLWIKVLHILFVMAWIAGLFYLPRILVHYVEGTAVGEDVRRLVVMATKLLQFSSIMAGLALSFGIWLWLVYDFSGAWLYAKLALVALLLVYQVQSYRYVWRMQAALKIPTSLFFRIYNEAALFIVVPILILVVIKPSY